MPWINDESGEKVYKPSIYTKEELPTWAEMYKEFYKEQAYSADEGEGPIDPYWGLPRNIVLLAICCNQLNKILFEDGLLSEMKSKFGIDDARFLIDSFRSGSEELYSEGGVGTDEFPPIYTIPLPTGKKNPFITNDHPRIDVSKMNGDRFIGYFVTINGNTEPYYEYEELFKEVIENIMESMKEYFEGERPGWKDDSGKNIKSTSEQKCAAGYDPAL